MASKLQKQLVFLVRHKHPRPHPENERGSGKFPLDVQGPEKKRLQPATGVIKCGGCRDRSATSGFAPHAVLADSKQDGGEEVKSFRV